jgi:sulfite reductase (NADPH) flavoprotein alpha-component
MTATIPQTPLSMEGDLLQKLASLPSQQQIWLSGYLYGIAQTGIAAPPIQAYQNGQNGSANGHYAAPPVQQAVAVAAKPSPVTILYGSQTGNSKKAANETAEKLKSKGLEVKVVDMNDYATKNLKDEKLLLISVSTQGEGDPPTAAEEFYAFLHGSRAPKLSADTQFSVLSLGDKSYLNFCTIGQDFDKKLEQLGAKRLHDRTDCDVDWHDDAAAWAEKVAEKIAALVPAGGQQPAISYQQNGFGAAIINPQTAAPKPKFDRKNPLEAEVLEKIQMNGRSSVKETWHVELGLGDSGLTYEVGDALAVFATNSERIVAETLKAANVDPSVKVDFDGQNQVLGEVLLEKAELSVLTRDVLQKYSDLAKNDNLKSLLADPKAIQNYVYGRDVVDLLTDFQTPDLNPQALANILRKMPPRAYSIASSLAAHPDEVHLTVGAVRYHAQGRNKQGVASTFLADRLEIGQKVKVFVEENEFFKLPQDNNADIIMVGPGTGIAPFRAFVEERAERGANGKNWLIFGNPNFETDFLYQTEWQNYLKNGVLSRLDVAFSRDQAQKIYVQDRILGKSKQIYDWLENGATIYVCGDKNRMAKDVEQAFIQVAMREGGYDLQKATDCVKDLRKKKRYLEDVY